ncbi:MAG: hypothetical protein ABJN84_06490 [Flavobacteriaceae bacterium]
MRYFFLIVIFCFSFPLIGQEESQLPFNERSYPKLYSKNAFTILKKQGEIKSILEQNNKRDKSITKTKRWNMPILKPKSNNLMPVSPVDTAHTYFLRVYPSAKG